MKGIFSTHSVYSSDKKFDSHPLNKVRYLLI